MQKRSEANREEKHFFRTKLRNTAFIVFCILFALSTIYAVDVATDRLTDIQDQKYAVKASKIENGIIRFDLVGEQYYLNLNGIKYQLDKLIYKAKGLISEIENTIK